jgi:thioesterase domain-containing protein
MAALYVNHIRQIQRTGPYFLGGWSMGGLVAFEMARQLQQEGETIGPLILFDTFPPPGNKRSANGTNQLSMLARFALEMGRSLRKDAASFQGRFEQLGPEEQKMMVMEELIHDEVLSRERAEMEMSDLLGAFSRNWLAMEEYRLRPANLRIALFQAADGKNQERAVREWKRWSKDVEFHLVPGSHYTMLQRPFVSSLATAVNRCMTS